MELYLLLVTNIGDGCCCWDDENSSCCEQSMELQREWLLTAIEGLMFLLDFNGGDRCWLIWSEFAAKRKEFE